MSLAARIEWRVESVAQRSACAAVQRAVGRGRGNTRSKRAPEHLVGIALGHGRCLLWVGVGLDGLQVRRRPVVMAMPRMEASTNRAHRDGAHGEQRAPRRAGGMREAMAARRARRGPTIPPQMEVEPDAAGWGMCTPQGHKEVCVASVFSPVQCVHAAKRVAGIEITASGLWQGAVEAR